MTKEYEIGTHIKTNRIGIDGEKVEGTITRKNEERVVSYLISTKGACYRIFEDEIVNETTDENTYLRNAITQMNEQLDELGKRMNTIIDLAQRITKTTEWITQWDPKSVLQPNVKFNNGRRKSKLFYHYYIKEGWYHYEL